MAEKEYIEREKLKQAFSADTQGIRGWDVDLFDLLMDEIDEVPAADVVEVVRCKDCIHYSSNKPKSQLHRSGYCLLNEDVTDDRREETDYCSYGERKELTMANCENCVKSDVCKYYEPKSTAACEHFSEPVRHGHWVEEDTAITCPICTRSYDTDFEIKRSVVLRFKYCPECGAKMDGDNNV